MVEVLGGQGDRPISRGMTLLSTNETAKLVVFYGSQIVICLAISKILYP